MTPCVRCNRHVREEICPFCGAQSRSLGVQSARGSLGRVARTALFAAGAVALTECSSSEPSPQPLYGSPCVANPDACVVVQPEAGADASDAAKEAAPDAAPDAAQDATND